MDVIGALTSSTVDWMAGDVSTVTPAPHNVTLSTASYNETSETTAAYVGDSVLYLSENELIHRYVQYKIAWVLDTIYAPICSILGITGNTLSFIVLMLSRMRNTTTYSYMAALSCTDTIVLIVNLLFMVRKFPGHETLYDGTCGFIFFLMYFSIHYNVQLMITMTLERFLAIRYPLHAPNWFTLKRARIAIVVEFFIALFLDMHVNFTRTMVLDPVTGKKFCGPSSDFNKWFLAKVWPWVDAVIYCYAPLTGLFVLNILIIREVKRSGKKQRQLTQKDKGSGEEDKAKSSMEKQLTRMLLLVSFTFLAFVTPMAIIIVVERYFWVRYSPEEDATYHLIRTICNNMMYTNHALNFLMYCISGQKFRNNFKEIILCRKEQGRSGSRSRDTGVKKMTSDRPSVSASQDSGLTTSLSAISVSAASTSPEGQQEGQEGSAKY